MRRSHLAQPVMALGHSGRRLARPGSKAGACSPQRRQVRTRGDRREIETILAWERWQCRITSTTCTDWCFNMGSAGEDADASLKSDSICPQPGQASSGRTYEAICVGGNFHRLRDRERSFCRDRRSFLLSVAILMWMDSRLSFGPNARPLMPARDQWNGVRSTSYMARNRSG